MLGRRKSYNPKRCFDPDPRSEDMERWIREVHYTGNPKHKRNLGNFHLTPPTCPRADKTLCDGAGILDKADAERLLHEGIAKGLVSNRKSNEYPQNVWALTDSGIPMEAQLENSDKGTYHGYPMPRNDPFREEVIARWRLR